MGSKLGIDATKKLPGEGFKRPWPKRIRTTDEAARKELMTFVVVGGGPTGVEIAGQLVILARYTLRPEFSRIDTADARVILVDAGDRVIPTFTERLSAKAARNLAELGVTVREHAQATAIDGAGLTIKVVPRRDLMAEAMALAKTMAQLAPIAMKQNKQYARRRTEADFRACARFCESAHHASFAAGDAKRGMEAFLTKKR